METEEIREMQSVRRFVCAFKRSEDYEYRLVEEAPEKMSWHRGGESARGLTKPNLSH
jgi:hypothetical protein